MYRRAAACAPRRMLPVNARPARKSKWPQVEVTTSSAVGYITSKAGNEREGLDVERISKQARGRVSLRACVQRHANNMARSARRACVREVAPQRGGGGLEAAQQRVARGPREQRRPVQAVDKARPRVV